MNEMLEDCILFYCNASFFTNGNAAPVHPNCQCNVIGDRTKLFQVKCVVFHLPSLLPEECLALPKLYGSKPQPQIWVIHCQESVANYPLLDDPEFMQLFDYEISYRQTAHVWAPYFNQEDLQVIQSATVKPKEKFCTAFISSGLNLSKRKQLLYKLMSYLPIDSYGSFMNNQTLPEDKGAPHSHERALTKLNVISQYRFTVAFENSLCPDYVTEKFFHPLMAGSIPIYWGAPNSEEFSPGDRAYINAADFNSIQELAEFLKAVDEAACHEWRKQPIRQNFLEKAEKTQGEIFDRLWNLILDNNQVARVIPQVESTPSL